MTKVECENLGGTGGSMVGYLHDASPEMPNRRIRPSVIVCPGGGYEFLSQRETDPPAFAFFAQGYNVFVLTYTIRQPGDVALGLKPLSQLSAAVMEVRKRHEEWNCAPDKIAVCGFSAGGHLAASLGVLWDSPALRAIQDTGNGQNRPNGMILCYAVITAGTQAHRGSIRALAEDDAELAALFSLEKHVTGNSPPAFIWHTMTDDAVPVENAFLMASALHAAGVPVECHLYEKGTDFPSVSRRRKARTPGAPPGWGSASTG